MRPLAAYHRYAQSSLRLYYRWRRSPLGWPQRWLESHPQPIFASVAAAGAVLGFDLVLAGGLGIVAAFPLFILAGFMVAMLYALHS